MHFPKAGHQRIIKSTPVAALGPGAYGFWNAAGVPRVEVVDLRRQTLEIPGQEILTKDKASIRVNVWAEYRVTDAVNAKQSVKDYAEHLYRVRNSCAGVITATADGAAFILTLAPGPRLLV